MLSSSGNHISQTLAHLLGRDRGAKVRLATACGVSPQAVNGWLRTGRIAKGNLRQVAEFFGVPVSTLIVGAELDDSDIPQKVEAPGLFDMPFGPLESFRLPALLPPAALMLPGSPVPDLFVSATPDDAMAPARPVGTSLIFRAGPPTRFGGAVLVEDAQGRRYMRIYAQGLGDEWVAKATHRAYVSLESARDGLRVLAHEWAVITG